MRTLFLVLISWNQTVYSVKKCPLRNELYKSHLIINKKKNFVFWGNFNLSPTDLWYRLRAMWLTLRAGYCQKFHVCFPSKSVLSEKVELLLIKLSKQFTFYFHIMYQVVLMVCHHLKHTRIALINIHTRKCMSKKIVLSECITMKYYYMLLQQDHPEFLQVLALILF